MKNYLQEITVGNGTLLILQVVYIFIVCRQVCLLKQRKLFCCDETIAPNQALKLTE
jgi:hypothetical protein